MSSILSGGESYLQSDDEPPLSELASRDGMSSYDPGDLISSWMVSDNDPEEQATGVVRDKGNTKSEKAMTWSKRPSRKKILIVGTMGVALGIVALVVGIISATGSRGSPNPSSSSPPIVFVRPTATPTSSPSTTPLNPEEKKLFDFLSSVSFDSGTALKNSLSPQFQAAMWLLENKNLQDYSDERKIQRYVLATLYYSTHGELWSDRSGWLSDEHECEWGFGKWGNGPCGSTGDTLVDVQLTNNQLSGTLPPEIGLLSDNLLYLDLGNNLLSGSIPTELGSLHNIKLMNLQQNSVSGPLPSEIGEMTSLTEMLADKNRMSGPLPDTLWQLSNMEQLKLGENQFKGTLATEIGLLKNLTMLSANDNNFKGTVPTELGLLSSLEELDLSNNPLNGIFPNTVCDLSLDAIGLTCTSIFCSCCNDLCLQEFLAGASPDGGISLSKNSSSQYMAYEWLSLDPNLEEYGTVQLLQRFALATLYYSTEGDDWDDDYNYLDYDSNECEWGVQPDSSPSRLTIKSAWASSVQGDEHREKFAIDNNDNTRWASDKNDEEWIAVDLGEIYALSSIRLEWEAASAEKYEIQVSDNKNDWKTAFTEDNGGGDTETIDLDGYSGRYVRMYGMARNTEWGYSLYEITVRGSTIADAPCDENLNIQQIVLNNNGLQGSLPPELSLLSNSLETLILSENSMLGSIASEIGLLTSLKKLDLTSNDFTGVIPPEMGNLENLNTLMLGGNNLGQAVPPELENLTNLKVLALEDNDLTGTVPAGLCNNLTTTLIDVVVDCLEVDCRCCELCTGRLNGGN